MVKELRIIGDNKLYINLFKSYYVQVTLVSIILQMRKVRMGGNVQYP